MLCSSILTNPTKQYNLLSMLIVFGFDTRFEIPLKTSNILSLTERSSVENKNKINSCLKKYMNPIKLRKKHGLDNGNSK